MAFHRAGGRKRIQGGSKFHGSTGDKAPAGVANHADRMRKDVVNAVDSGLRQTYTANKLTEKGSRPGGSVGETPLVAPSNALRTTGS